MRRGFVSVGLIVVGCSAPTVDLGLGGVDAGATDGIKVNSPCLSRRMAVGPVTDNVPYDRSSLRVAVGNERLYVGANDNGRLRLTTFDFDLTVISVVELDIENLVEFALVEERGALGVLYTDVVANEFRARYVIADSPETPYTMLEGPRRPLIAVTRDAEKRPLWFVTGQGANPLVSLRTEDHRFSVSGWLPDLGAATHVAIAHSGSALAVGWVDLASVRVRIVSAEGVIEFDEDLKDLQVWDSTVLSIDLRAGPDVGEFYLAVSDSGNRRTNVVALTISKPMPTTRFISFVEVQHSAAHLDEFSTSMAWTGSSYGLIYQDFRDHLVDTQIYVDREIYFTELTPGLEHVRPRAADERVTNDGVDHRFGGIEVLPNGRTVVTFATRSGAQYVGEVALLDPKLCDRIEDQPSQKSGF